MNKRTTLSAAALLITGLCGSAAMAQNAPAPALPNGATSLNEAYQDWNVICATAETGRICAMTQQHRRQETNQLVLAAEINAVDKSGAKGTLVLPFGLALAAGITLQIDEGKPVGPLAFATCVPAGCIVPLAFDAATVKALRSGAALKLTAKAHDSQQEISFGMSLKGFAAALDRIAALGKS